MAETTWIPNGLARRGAVMGRIDLTSFCDCYLKALSTGTRSDWQSARAWTAKATAAAVAACSGLRVSKEYLRLDVMGYERVNQNQHYNWRMRVAFEHEQKPNCWPDELCKLAHIVADLRVLAFYHRFDRDPNALDSLRATLQERVDLLKDLLSRVSGSEWLFIVGAYSPSDQPFVAFTLNGDGQVTSLPLSIRLHARDLQLQELGQCDMSPTSPMGPEPVPQ